MYSFFLLTLKTLIKCNNSRYYFLVIFPFWEYLYSCFHKEDAKTKK